MPIYALGDAEPAIAAGAFVHPDAVVIGHVEIGEDSTIWPTAVLRGDDGQILIGSAEAAALYVERGRRYRSELRRIS